MAAGVSGAVISTSKHYKILTAFVVVFGLMIIGTNLIFIKPFGIVGASIASAISALAYSLMRLVFLKRKYGMQPFSYRHILILIIGAGAYLLSLLVPDLYSEKFKVMSLILDIIVRSTLISVVFISLVYVFKLSPDLQRFAGKILKRLKSDSGR